MKPTLQERARKAAKELQSYLTHAEPGSALELEILERHILAALTSACEQLEEDGKRLDWLEKHLLCLTHGNLTCSVDMGGYNINAQFFNDAKGRGERTRARTVREAIDNSRKSAPSACEEKKVDEIKEDLEKKEPTR